MESRPRLAEATIACSLDAAAVPTLIDEWRALSAHVTGRTAVDHGVRLELDEAAPIDEVVRLVRAEHSCCRFLAFSITVDTRGVALEVRAPVEAQKVIASLFGVAN
jgi:hypothetical protein